MIDRLTAEAAAEADEKAYCDEETAKTQTKKGELQDDIAKLTAKIDQATARSERLKAEVKELQEELATLAKEQAQMDATRQEQLAAYTQAKADLEQGLSGVRKALDVLREYYAADEGAALVQDNAQFSASCSSPSRRSPQSTRRLGVQGGSIIGILEV